MVGVGFFNKFWFFDRFYTVLVTGFDVVLGFEDFGFCNRLNVSEDCSKWFFLDFITTNGHQMVFFWTFITTNGFPGS